MSALLAAVAVPLMLALAPSTHARAPRPAAVKPAATATSPAPKHVPRNMLVRIVVHIGALTLVDHGRTVACPRDEVQPVCAMLRSGKRVAGHLSGGDLVVEVRR